MKTVGIIPARYESSRFPGKPLAQILGKSMILWVCEIVEKALGKENTYVATDDDRIKKVVEDMGYEVVLTSKNCLTGTDRVAEAAQAIDADIYINIQGDEPMLEPDEIERCVTAKIQDFDKVINFMCELSPKEDPSDVNIPKVLVNQANELIYMSRLPIPGIKNPKYKPTYYKQVCIYAFNREELLAFSSIEEKSEFEKCEDIEILRFFNCDIPVRMVETRLRTIAVDIPSDIQRVEKQMSL